jgi:hypothetical protein
MKYKEDIHSNSKTICPYSKKAFHKLPDIIYVGTYFCTLCRHFISQDHNKKTIKCHLEDREKKLLEIDKI